MPSRALFAVRQNARGTKSGTYRVLVIGRDTDNIKTGDIGRSLGGGWNVSATPDVASSR
jgi:hypothetical protein